MRERPSNEHESGVCVHSVLFSENGMVEISYSEERDRILPMTEVRTILVSVDDLLDGDEDKMPDLVDAAVEMIDAAHRRKRNPPASIER